MLTKISPDTLELMGRCFRTLFKNELSRKSILTRVVERRLDVHQAWQQFETSQVTVDKLRDVLLRQNVLATTNDIQNLINLISKKEGGIMEEEDLRQFVGA